MTDADTTTFRFRLLPVFLFAAISAVVLVNISLLLEMEETDATILLIATGACIVLVLFLCWVLVLVFKVRIDGESIHGQDFFGAKLSVKFAEVTRVTMFHVPGITFYRIAHEANSRELWLPQFLSDERGFITLACERMDEGNPLREALEQRKSHIDEA